MSLDRTRGQANNALQLTGGEGGAHEGQTVVRAASWGAARSRTQCSADL